MGPLSVPDGAHRKVSIGFNWGEESEERSRGGIKDIGKLPSGAGVSLTTGCTSALHTPG